MKISILSILVISLLQGCSYQLTSKNTYPFKTANITVNYVGRYFSVPAYFKPAIKEELKYRIADIKFNSPADLDIKINILSVELDAMGITYLSSHPTANSYLLKILFSYSFKTKKYTKTAKLTRLRNFSSGLNTAHTSVASVSKDYKFKDAVKSLVKDVSREIVNSFLAEYSSSIKIKEKMKDKYTTIKLKEEEDDKSTADKNKISDKSVVKKDE